MQGSIQNYKVYHRAREIVPQFRAFAVLVEDPDSIPRTDVVAHNHSFIKS